MDKMLTHLANVGMIVESEAVTGSAGTGLPLGILVVGFIAIPVLVLLLASVLGKPRSTKITSLFLGWIFMMFCVFIIAIIGLSFLTSIFY
jgi:hypothetical protein